MEIKDNICPSYRTRIVKRRLSNYEQGVYFGRHGIHKEFVEEEHHYCISTRGWEACTCGGDRNKCDLYSDPDDFWDYIDFDAMEELDRGED